MRMPGLPLRRDDRDDHDDRPRGRDPERHLRRSAHDFAGLPPAGRTDKYLLDSSSAAGTESTRFASRLRRGHVPAKLSRTHSAAAAVIFDRAAAGAKSWSPPSMTTRRCVTRAWESTAA